MWHVQIWLNIIGIELLHVLAMLIEIKVRIGTEIIILGLLISHTRFY